MALTKAKGITRSAIKKVAKLANLPITDQEEVQYSTQLSKILEFVEQLNSADTQNIEPTFNVTDQANVMRDDIASDSLTQAEAVQNARSRDGLFVTKGVFEDD